MAIGPCIDVCLKQGASLVLVSQGKVYKLVDAGKVVPAHAGQTVSLTGELLGDTVRVTKIETRKAAAKS